jgi:hypothetical protein
MNLKRSTIIFAAVGILIVIINSISALSSQPAFCGLCHGKEYASWQTSTHKDFTCNFCHRRPDVASFAGQRVDVMRMVLYLPVSWFSHYPTTAQVSNVVCRSCHTDDKKTTENNGIRMNHKAVIKSNYACTECHSTLVHGKAVPNPRFATMDKCAECHVGGSPTGACTTCHTDNVDPLDRTFAGPWKTTHGKNWRKLHGMGNMKSCTLCHSENFCLRCHSVTMPHPDSWINIHGAEALKNRQGCLKCHEESFCKSCHQTDMPHPNNWLEVHPKVAKTITNKMCLSCHMEKGCQRCHSQHIHPGLPRDWLKQLRQGMQNGK